MLVRLVLRMPQAKLVDREARLTVMEASATSGKPQLEGGGWGATALGRCRGHALLLVIVVMLVLSLTATRLTLDCHCNPTPSLNRIPSLSPISSVNPA